MLVYFKECFCNLVKDLIDTYDQMPSREIEYPFAVINVTVLPAHWLGHSINQIRCVLDVWSIDTNTRNIDVLVSDIVLKTNRISVFNFYGKIESVQTLETQEENLSRRQIIYDYKYIGGY